MLPKLKGVIPVFGVVADEHEKHHSRPWIVTIAKADENGDPTADDDRACTTWTWAPSQSSSSGSRINSAAVLLSMQRENAVKQYTRVLGIGEGIDDISVRQIKLAYRKAALAHHPDRGGDPTHQ